MSTTARKKKQIDKNELFEYIKTLTLQKDNSFQTNKKDLTQWQHKLVSYLLHNNTFDIISAKKTAETIIHYSDENDIKSGEIRTQPEIDYIKSVYSKVSTGLDHKTKLQTPTETFGIELDGKQCRKCKNKNVSMMPMQKRSADEPMNYFYECRDCSAKWKE